MTNPIIDKDGTQKWYKDGERHRDNGPAVIRSNGSKFWYQDGKLHRVDGPAAINTHGTECWYQYDQLHNSNGPAIIYSNGSHKWYIRGYPCTFDEYCNKLELSNEDQLLLKIQYG